jgi:hypothetical protein
MRACDVLFLRACARMPLNNPFFKEACAHEAH